VMSVEITALEPNRLLAARIDSHGFTGDIRYQLTDQNGKTRLEYTAVTHYKIWLAQIMEPVITPAAQKKLGEDTAKLKALIQAQ
jgi:carbon monoxide dehydrogenase subunit G